MTDNDGRIWKEQAALSPDPRDNPAGPVAPGLRHWLTRTR